MKKSIFTIVLMLLAVAAQAQIKLHSNGRLTLQSTSNSTTQGISISAAPNWNVDINGDMYFHKTAFFLKTTTDYESINMAKGGSNLSIAWALTNQSWNNPNFYVYANGDAYAIHHYAITNNMGDSKGSEAIDGEEALSIVAGLNGYYYEPEEQEIPNLENNEFVAPEAIEAMYADFEKRTAGLSGDNLEEVFPEAVRTDYRNRLCIDYQSVVTVLVEAVKQQQREIEELRSTIEKVGKKTKP